MIIQFDKERDWDTLKLPDILLIIIALSLLRDPVFLEVEHVAHVYELLLQFLIVWHVLAVTVETY